MPIPAQIEFFLETPIYENIKIDDADLDAIFDLLFSEKQIDAYCIHCKKNSVFHSDRNYPSMHGAPGYGGFPISNVSEFRKHLGGLPYLQGQLFTIEFNCTRDKTHKMCFVVAFDASNLIKIGQYPSLADIVSAESAKYRRLLSTEKYKEFNRAVGLTTHGVGIGAFVYLRRIFEDLISDAYSNSKVKATLNEEAFFKLRMEEKIEVLKLDLPEFLVKNRIIYSILSKGLHELSEQECLEIFPVLKVGIELILDVKLEEQIKAEKSKEAEIAIRAIQTTLKKT